MAQTSSIIDLATKYNKYPELKKAVDILKARNEVTREHIELLEKYLGSGYFSSTLSKAISYVGGTGQVMASSGVLALLKRHGMKPESNVLEIGSGCLLGSRHILEYQQSSETIPGKFVGIEPNVWLLDAAREDPSISDLARTAIFLHNLNFDACSLDIKFDYIVSHSILSHAADWQLIQYLTNTTKCLKDDGVSLASLRLTTPNNYGHAGSDKDESHFKEWVYPGNSYFSLDSIEKSAKSLNLNAKYEPEFTKIFCDLAKGYTNQKHDWILFQKRGAPPLLQTPAA